MILCRRCEKRWAMPNADVVIAAGHGRCATRRHRQRAGIASFVGFREFLGATRRGGSAGSVRRRQFAASTVGSFGGPAGSVSGALVDLRDSSIAAVPQLQAALQNQNPRVQMAALLLLDQPPRLRGTLAPEQVIQRVNRAGC